MRTGLEMLGISGSYFEHPKDPIVEGESHDETRYAGLAEVMHTAHHVSFHDWENTWIAGTSRKNPLKGHAANTVFFDLLDRAPKNRTVTTLR